jgi:hypothetical protein
MIYVIYALFQADMHRMPALRLMLSHTYFYRKLSQYRKDYHRGDIPKNVELEGKRITALIQKEQFSDKEEDTSIQN